MKCYLCVNDNETQIICQYVDLRDNMRFSVESKAFLEWKFHRSIDKTNDLENKEGEEELEQSVASVVT